MSKIPKVKNLIDESEATCRALHTKIVIKQMREAGFANRSFCEGKKSENVFLFDIAIVV